MEYISEKDYYETRFASLISDIDREVLVELYQPLIGHLSVTLYATLFHEKNKCSEVDTFDHTHLFDKMQVSAGELLAARKALEAVGLLRSFLKEETGLRYYVYVLYAPKSPRDFFDDVLFKGLLIKYVGEKEAMRLALIYKVDYHTEGFNDVTSSFVDTFNPDFDDPSFRKDLKVDIKGRKSGRVSTSFDYDAFFATIEKNSQIKRDSFSKKDLKEIERLATLFSLDESTMADIVIVAYDPDNKAQRVNFQVVSDRAKDEARFPFFHKKRNGERSKVSGNSELASKIKLMDQMAPAEYLRILQNNTAPSRADLNIVDDLSKNYGLPNGVINALIDYVLAKNNNVLSRHYTEKIAASLTREGLTTVIDTMNYLVKINSMWKVNKPQVLKNVGNAEKAKDDEISDDELESILASIESKKKD
ncbi:MAG: hypothetical protein EOM77_03365 [Bacteroidia bacterium]|nr:hypothetical protein [Bacteroidia bacterium]